MLTGGEQPTKALVIEPTPLALTIVRPVVTPEEAKELWEQFQRLKQAILEESDFQEFENPVKNRAGEIIRWEKHKFPKKSAFRKLATAFNVTDEIIEESDGPKEVPLGARFNVKDYLQIFERDGQKYGIKWVWKCVVRAIAPNGRFAIGEGRYSTDERGLAHTEHDGASTAHTRAKNRAISDLVAAGEVSAEEILAPDTTEEEKGQKAAAAPATAAAAPAGAEPKVTAVAPGAPGDITLDQLTEGIKALGYADRGDVYKDLEVTSIGEWRTKGKTLKEALETLTEMKVRRDRIAELKAKLHEGDVKEDAPAPELAVSTDVTTEDLAAAKTPESTEATRESFVVVEEAGAPEKLEETVPPEEGIQPAMEIDI